MIEHETIKLFGTEWWVANIPTTFVICAVIWFAKDIDHQQATLFAKIIGVLLLASFAFTNIYVIHIGKWYVRSSLPLEICRIATILSGMVLIWQNQLAYEFLYYWGIPGGFYSLLTPEFAFGTQGWLFPAYFISHGGILLSVLFLTLVLGLRPRRGSWWKVALYTQAVLALVAFVNWLLDANYMYLCKRPIVQNPLVIGDWPCYILGLEIIGFVHFVVTYIPFGLKYRRQKGNRMRMTQRT